MEDLSELLKAIYEQLVSCNEKLGGINEKLFEIENVVMDSSRSTDRIKDCVDDFQEFGVQLKGSLVSMTSMRNWYQLRA